MNQGGGVGLWVQKNLDFDQIKVTWKEWVCEMQAIHLPKNNLIIINVYKPFGDMNMFMTTLEENLELI